VDRTRRAQGIPRKVTDPLVLAKVAKMIDVFIAFPTRGTDPT